MNICSSSGLVDASAERCGKFEAKHRALSCVKEQVHLSNIVHGYLYKFYISHFLFMYHSLIIAVGRGCGV